MGWPSPAGNRQVVGSLSASDVVAGHRRALEEDTRRLSMSSAHATALDVRAGRASPLVGRPIAEAGLSRGCLVVTVRHGDGMSFATGATVPVVGDVLSVLTRPEHAEAVERLIAGEEAVGEPNGAGPGKGGSPPHHPHEPPAGSARPSSSRQ